MGLNAAARWIPCLRKNQVKQQNKDIILQYNIIGMLKTYHQSVPFDPSHNQRYRALNLANISLCIVGILYCSCLSCTQHREYQAVN